MKKREKQTDFFAGIIENKIKETELSVCILGKSFKPDNGCSPVSLGLDLFFSST
jgi:hypothetical protein